MINAYNSGRLFFSFPAMRKILFGVGVLLACWSAPVWAMPQFTAGDQVYLNESAADDTYLAGGWVSVDQPINGDLVVAGGTVSVNADIEGELIAAGGTVNLRANVQDDVRIGGGTINIRGEIGDDLIVAGGTVTIEKGTKIGGSVVIASGMVVFNGQVAEGFKLTGGQLIFGGEVKGDARWMIDEQVEILPGATVGGSLEYKMPKQLTTKQLSFVKGKVDYQKIETPSPVVVWTSVAIGLITMVIGSTLMAWVVSLFLYINLGNVLSALVTAVRERPWRRLWKGVLTVIGLVLFMLLMFVTVVGVKIGLVLGLTLVLVSTLMASVNGFFVTTWLFKKMDKTPSKNIWRLLLGILVYEVIAALPIVGWIWVLGLSLMMWGAWGLVAKELLDKVGKLKLTLNE